MLCPPNKGLRRRPCTKTGWGRAHSGLWGVTTRSMSARQRLRRDGVDGDRDPLAVIVVVRATELVNP